MTNNPPFGPKERCMGWLSDTRDAVSSAASAVADALPISVRVGSQLSRLKPISVRSFHVKAAGMKFTRCWNGRQVFSGLSASLFSVEYPDDDRGGNGVAPSCDQILYSVATW